MNKAFLNWSSGKDALMALHKLRTEPTDLKVDLLFTTLNAENDRVSMHGIPEDLLQQQAHSLGIELRLLKIPPNTSLNAYNKLLEKELLQLKEIGYTHSVYGDILLEDLREYRENQLKKVGLKAVFPLWKADTQTLAKEFCRLGYRAKVVCINSAKMPKSMAGREFDQLFLEDLPPKVDWCGENGEFHTFVYAGPLFQKELNFSVGETHGHQYRPSEEDQDDCFTQEQAWDTDFWFTELIPR